MSCRVWRCVECFAALHRRIVETLNYNELTAFHEIEVNANFLTTNWQSLRHENPPTHLKTRQVSWSIHPQLEWIDRCPSCIDHIFAEPREAVPEYREIQKSSCYKHM
jgi:hypothetical protein